MINGYFHSSYTVSNLDRSLKFYGETLGIENVRAQVSDQAYLPLVTGVKGCSLKIGFFQVEGDPTLLELVEYVAAKGPAAGTGFGVVGSPHLCWSVDNLDLYLKKLQQKGVQPLGQPRLLRDGLFGEAIGTFVLDPDGLIVELIELPGKKGQVGRLTALHHTGYTVSDIDQTIKMMSEKLAFKLLACDSYKSEYLKELGGLKNNQVKMATMQMPGSDHIMELWQFEKPVGVPMVTKKNYVGSAHMCFKVGDIMSVYDDFSKSGLKFVGPPVGITAGRNKGGFAIYFDGPDDIPFELFQDPPANVS